MREMFREIISFIGIVIMIGCIVQTISDSDETVKAMRGIADSNDNSSKQNVIQALNNAVSEQRLEEVIEPSIAKSEYGYKTITGQIKNVSGRTLSYVEILFNLYDKDGTQVGSAIANINNLAAGSIWKYSAVPMTMNDWATFVQSEIESW